MTFIDTPINTPITPSPNGIDCLGNGTWPGYECCCDECDYFLACFPGEKFWIETYDCQGDN